MMANTNVAGAQACGPQEVPGAPVPGRSPWNELECVDARVLASLPKLEPACAQGRRLPRGAQSELVTFCSPLRAAPC